MDVKEDDLCKNLLCYACLCVGRNVYEIVDKNLKNYYLEILEEIPLIKSNNFSNYTVCWECRAVLQKCCAFREQVKDSYRILQSYTSENLYESLLSNIARQPRLNIHSTEAVDIKPSEQNDYEIPIVKEEVNNWNCSEDPTNIKNKLSDSDSDNIKDDFTTIESELKTIVASMKREDKKKSKRKKNKKSLKENTVVEGSCEAINLPEVNLNKDEDSWECRDNDIPPLEDTYLSDTYNIETEQLNTEYSSIFCSIGEEKGDNRNKRSKKTVKSLSKKPLPQKYSKNVRTVELTYEEMLLERENDCKRDTYITSEYKCETCLIGFYYKKSYQTHMHTKHNPNIGSYICPICKTRISSVDSFSTHYRRHTRRYECTICLKRTVDLKVMQQHYYSSHDISLKEYKCNVCGLMSNSIDSHRYHKDSHKGRLQCPDCEKTFRHRAGLMNHRFSIDSHCYHKDSHKGRLQCPDCEKTFSHRAVIMNYRLAVHEFHNAFPCTVCDKVFRWKTSLKRHLEKHDSKNKSSTLPYCSSCNIEFASICSYQRHMKNSLKHVSQDQLKFICDHCSKRFSDKTKLRDHIEEKHLHKTFQCHICLKPSKNRVGLDQHIRNVHKGRPKNKICHHCGRGFPTKMQLESHIRTHTGERPFICEYCPSTFSHQSNLYKHNKQVHLNIKSKRYPICKKRKEDTDPVGKVPIIDGAVDNDPYRPVLQYSPERGFVL